jgi:hypothetical protein
LPRNPQCLLDGNRSTSNAIGKRVTSDQFEDERLGVAVVLDAIDGGDARMVQRRQHLRFPLEPREPVWIGRIQVGQHFDGDVAAETRVARAIDLAHSAFAKLGEDVVVCDRLTDHALVSLASAKPRQRSRAEEERATAGQPAPSAESISYWAMRAPAWRLIDSLRLTPACSTR